MKLNNSCGLLRADAHTIQPGSFLQNTPQLPYLSSDDEHHQLDSIGVTPTATLF